MASIINAVSSTGITQTADGSGIIKLQSAGVTTNALAWVNFNGTGTVAIRSAYNVSSITDNGTGDYTVNFTNALSDANYAFVGSCGRGASNSDAIVNENVSATPSTTTVRFGTTTGAGTLTDMSYVNVIIFGN